MSKKPPKKPQAPKRREPERKTRFGSIALAVGVVIVVGVVVAFAVPRGRSSKATHENVPRSGPAPAFDERDVVTGRSVTSESLRGRNVLLFFSEGVMCQACFQQIQALQADASKLEQRRLVLVNITTDSADLLRQAAEAYRITTPLISDEDRDMSNAYDVLGGPGAMHADTAGHTFVLVDAQGKIRWRRDYSTMYVPPAQLLSAMPRV